MAGRQREKRPPSGLPGEIVLFATPEGWRHGLLTVEGGMLCGRLDVPIGTGPPEARAAAADMVTRLAREFHGTEVEVTWDPPRKPWSWTARITRVAGEDIASPDVGR
ncbi:hypothetical protein I3F58_00275 [Streptomyces sp. MUM 203J]|uniref:hypothetical protein n=1 Tax=Streptomyces sp. MUM 203J TaxID=2791990 RepID=UPI001F04EC66|nr:hypothetical protein [Streptomyces sp. MUM 203J]MCH0538020.1 hypothetical protein [Streptomyces sp. MUM 203J]